MTKRRRVIATIVLVVLVILLYIQIFWFSNLPVEISQQQSLTLTEIVVNFLERTLSIDLPFNDSYTQIMQLDLLVRKTAHFLEYALLAVLLYSIALVWEKKGLGAVLLVLALAVLLAVADEWHQTYVPGRSGLVSDVIIDSVGAICGMAALFLAKRRFVSRQAKTHVSQKEKAKANN
jgi:VanZ family protein